jgi:ABC-type uncharacterized transport system substrate-binding protein
MQVIRRCLAIVLLAGFFSSAGLADALPRSLLILNEGSAGIQGYADTAAALRATINAGASEPFAFYIEDLDLNLFQGLKYQWALLTYLREKYFDRRIGIIVANGTEALKLALQLRSDPRWGEIPIVFATVDERRVRSLMPLPNVTGRFLEFSLGASVDAARALVTNLRQIILVGDPLDRQPFRGHFAGELPGLSKNLEVTNLSGLPLAEVKQRVAALPETSAILYTTMTTDGAGHQYLPNEALRIIAKAANRPIVADIDNRIGNGAAGGLVVVPKLIGEEAAVLVQRLLNGEKIADLPIGRSGALKPVFDWRDGGSQNPICRAAAKSGFAHRPHGSNIAGRSSRFWVSCSRRRS